MKEWGQGSVNHPVVLKIKMDGPIAKLSGASGAMGFTITVPDRRSLSTSSELARKDKRLASVNVVNTSHGAEVDRAVQGRRAALSGQGQGRQARDRARSEGHGKKIAKKKGEGKPSKKKHSK